MQDRWIDADDKSPDGGVLVIVHAPDEEPPVTAGTCTDSGLWQNIDGEEIEVTEWMPFPEAPCCYRGPDTR